jgi:predicted MFS family arabinose efflux permease
MLAGDRVGFVYAGLVVENLAVCFLRPALQAATPAVVPDEAALASANSLLALSSSTWRLTAPLLGTYLAADGRFPEVVLADLASYLVAAAILGTVPIPAVARAVGVAVRVRDGLRFVAGDRTLRGLLLGSCVYWTANAGLTALLVPFADHRLQAPRQAVGILIAGLGAGYLCGSGLSRWFLLRCPARALLTISYGMVGACFLVAFTTTSLAVAAAAVTASGLPGAVCVVAVGHHLQTSSPDGMRGRVSAAFQTSDAIAAVCGALAAPVVLAVAGLAGALVILSASVLAAAATAAALLPP